ncbi:TRAP transporter large permease [Hoeflea alexandrii]|uniref:TRAP transporter large permease n=1 Tax=Hoeflea alexandrii TaxID=288436 RepID=UPI0022AFE4F8|nr:TRAP transporter large permease [Hoeflea alexandrii]MCZ4291559.1 TRAP transporter large permease [Hoeflea alexandrii]
MLLASIGFLAAFALIFFRVPIAIALAVVGAVGFAYVTSPTAMLTILALTAKDTTFSESLAVIPLFLLMGNFLAESGIAKDAYEAAQRRFHKTRGGLAMATILASAGFAAVCGSSVATVVTIGQISIPSMRRFGYPDDLSAASVAAGGTLGILIPPSIVMVIYGISTETNIGMLFAAGLIPGVIGTIGYLLAVRWKVLSAGGMEADPDTMPDHSATSTVSVWFVALLFFIVLGGIYSGLFTPTEAAAVGAVGALAFALASRRVGIKSMLAVLNKTVSTTAVLFALLIGASIFAEFINRTGAHVALLDFINQGGMPGWLVLLVIIITYLVLGCVLESISMMLLTIPLFFPIITGLGYDPVWFGILVVILVEVGLITPPLGINLFVVRSIAPDIPVSAILRGIVPFVVADVVRVTIIVVFPGLVLWLPHLLF